MFYKQKYWEKPPIMPRKIYRDTVNDILKITNKYGLENKNLKVLDAGSGLGIYAEEFAKKVKKVIGVEPDFNAYKHSKPKKNLKFYNSTIEDFNTRERFDLVVSLTTIEHMPDAEESFKNIFKLLKVGGLVYITALNKLWPYEYHYKLWGLSYLPIPIANWYIKVMNRGESYLDSAYSRTYFGMKKLLNNFHCEYEFILPDHNASYLGCGDTSGNTLKYLGIKAIRYFPFLWIFSRGFIIVARKTK